MPQALGDYTEDDVLYFWFSTHKISDGSLITFASGDVSVYKDDSNTQSQAGVTLTLDQDNTGQHKVEIDTSADGAFYAAGSAFSVVATAGTVDSVAVTGTVIARFTMESMYSNTNVNVATWQGGAPNALSSGRVDASVGAMAADVITAAAHDESTAFPVKSVDSGSTQIARTGADGDTLETLSDEIAVVDATTDSIKAKTDLITAGEITVSSLVDENGNVSIRQYDDYAAGTSRITWTNSDGDWLNSDITGATITLKVRKRGTTTITTIPGAVVTATGTQVVAVDLTSAESGAAAWSELENVYEYHLRAEAGGLQQTLAFGDWSVSESFFTS